MNTPKEFLKAIPKLMPHNYLVRSRAKTALKTGQYESVLKFIADIRLLMNEDCWIGKQALKHLESCKKQ